MKETALLQNWKAPNDDLLPDFIIGGAMKSGTSTLHQILDSHPKIFIPNKEIHFFNIDCLIQHEGFHHYSASKDEWTMQTMQSNPDRMWDWYLDKFKGKDGLVKGEDSTTYLASAVAAERIAIQNKKIKLIFLLRQPTARAYSNYYHRLKSGRATSGFEDSIRFGSYSILNRSLYKEQLESYYKFIPRERIKVVLFEDFIKDTKKTVQEISEFIGVDFNEFPEHVFNFQANKTTLVTNVAIRTRRNYYLRNIINSRYNSSVPNKHPTSALRDYLFSAIRMADKIYYKLVSKIFKKKPRISNSTKAFLDQYFYSRLEGIDELVQKDILSKWFPNLATRSAQKEEEESLPKA